jgi:hypothetical protein
MDAATCDRCGRDLLAAPVRYVARIELFAAYDPPEVTAADLGRDLEAEMRELLNRIAEDRRSGEEIEKDVYEELRLDLCAECRREFARDPFGRARE